MVIDCSTSRLNNEHIFSSYRIFDFAAGLSNGKFAQNSVAGRYSQHITDAVGEGRMGITREDDDVSHHVGVIDLGYGQMDLLYGVKEDRLSGIRCFALLCLCCPNRRKNVCSIPPEEFAMAKYVQYYCRYG